MYQAGLNLLRPLFGKIIMLMKNQDPRIPFISITQGFSKRGPIQIRIRTWFLLTQLEIMPDVSTRSVL